jgi:cof-like hydrolase
LKKLITFDLDMTLLNHVGYTIPDSALAAVRKLRENGHIVAIATGRNLENHDGPDFISRINPHATIELNGTKITIGAQTVYRHLFDKDILRELIDFCLDKGYTIGLAQSDTDYYFNQEKLVEWDKKQWGISLRNFGDPNRILEMEVGTLAYIGDPVGALDIESNFESIRCPLFAGGLGADVIQGDVSKESGLLRLCEHYNIGIEDTVSFGDSMNDMEILKRAGVGVAMGNAHDDLKEVADMVTDDIDKDGIYKACVKLGLI